MQPPAGLAADSGWADLGGNGRPRRAGWILITDAEEEEPEQEEDLAPMGKGRSIWAEVPCDDAEEDEPEPEEELAPMVKGRGKAKCKGDGKAKGSNRRSDKGKAKGCYDEGKSKGPGKGNDQGKGRGNAQGFYDKGNAKGSDKGYDKGKSKRRRFERVEQEYNDLVYRLQVRQQMEGTPVHLRPSGWWAYFMD